MKALAQPAYMHAECNGFEGIISRSLVIFQVMFPLVTRLKTPLLTIMHVLPQSADIFIERNSFEGLMNWLAWRHTTLSLVIHVSSLHFLHCCKGTCASCRHAYQTKRLSRYNKSITRKVSSAVVTSDSNDVTTLHNNELTAATCRHAFQIKVISRGNIPNTSTASREAITSDSRDITTFHCHECAHAACQHAYQTKVILWGNRSIISSSNDDLITSDSRAITMLQFHECTHATCRHAYQTKAIS